MSVDVGAAAVWAPKHFKRNGSLKSSRFRYSEGRPHKQEAAKDLSKTLKLNNDCISAPKSAMDVRRKVNLRFSSKRLGLEYEFGALKQDNRYEGRSRSSYRQKLNAPSGLIAKDDEMMTASAVVMRSDFSMKSLREFLLAELHRERFTVSELLLKLNPSLAFYFTSFSTTHTTLHRLIALLEEKSCMRVKAITRVEKGESPILSPATKWRLCDFLVRHFGGN